MSLATSESDGRTSQPILTFSGNEHSRTSSALDNNIELKSFSDVAIDERT